MHGSQPDAPALEGQGLDVPLTNTTFWANITAEPNWPVDDPSPFFDELIGYEDNIYPPLYAKVLERLLDIIHERILVFVGGKSYSPHCMEIYDRMEARVKDAVRGEGVLARYIRTRFNYKFELLLREEAKLFQNRRAKINSTRDEEKCSWFHESSRHEAADGLLIFEFLDAVEKLGTPKEKEVVSMMMKGKGEEAIAARLGLNIRTVHMHIHNFLKKWHAIKA